MPVPYALTMLTDAPIVAVVPVTDLNKSKDFCTNMLGLKIVREMEQEMILEAGNGTQLQIYKRPPTPTVHTLASFKVSDIEATIDELTQKGITFEQYDFPGIKTDAKGIATHGNLKAAWFKDPDGHILCVNQFSE